MRIGADKIRNALLSLIATIAGATLLGIWNFYREWTIDEATEESTQFDNAEQKVKTINHVETVDPSDVKLIQNDLKHLIQEIHQQSSRLDKIEDLNQRTADQAYQTNKRLDTIKK